MPDFNEINLYIDPYFSDEMLEMAHYAPTQLGAHVTTNLSEESIRRADIVILGVKDIRGEDEEKETSNGPDVVRQTLYSMHYWHDGITIADLGNIKTGRNIGDTRAAMRAVLQELYKANKNVVIIGGSHDWTYTQYEAYKVNNYLIEASVIDMLIDLEEGEEINHRNYLMPMLTGQPNYLKHFNHIGFQSYYVNPELLQTLDKLRFDCYRLGVVRNDLHVVEPALRNSHMLSIDLNAVSYAYAPVNRQGSPNGFTGEEICTLTRFAGMSDKLNSLGIYGYDSDYDEHGKTAQLVSQMIWYYIDGLYARSKEANLADREEFLEFYVHMNGDNVLFMKSKRTGRWWMQLTETEFAPCTYEDYVIASNNDIPDRWLRALERMA